MLFNSKLIEFSQMSEEQIVALPDEIYAEYQAAMALYWIFLIITGVINIIGIVLFIKNRNNFSTERNAPALLESDKREAVVRIPSIVIAAVAMILLTILALFI